MNINFQYTQEIRATINFSIDYIKELRAIRKWNVEKSFSGVCNDHMGVYISNGNSDNAIYLIIRQFFIKHLWMKDVRYRRSSFVKCRYYATAKLAIFQFPHYCIHNKIPLVYSYGSHLFADEHTPELKICGFIV